MVIHYFLVEFGNTGELYDIGCIGDKDTLLQYWQNLSRDVRYKGSEDVTRLEEERKIYAEEMGRNYKPKKIRLGKEIKGVGQIVSCKFYCDRDQSLEHSRFLPKTDERYTFIEPIKAN